MPKPKLPEITDEECIQKSVLNKKKFKHIPKELLKNICKARFNYFYNEVVIKPIEYPLTIPYLGTLVISHPKCMLYLRYLKHARSIKTYKRNIYCRTTLNEATDEVEAFIRNKLLDKKFYKVSYIHIPRKFKKYGTI